MNMMRKYLLCMLLCLAAAGATAAAGSADSVSVAEDSSGRQIWGTTFALKRIVADAMVADGCAVVLECDTTDKGKTTKTGSLRCFALDGCKELWSRDVNPRNTMLCRTSGSGFFAQTLTQGKRLLEFVDTKSGDIQWKRNVIPVYFNDSLNIVIGVESVLSDSVKAFRMDNGEHLWSAKILSRGNYGWDQAVPLDRDRLLVVADNINVVDLRTGHLDVVKAKTFIADTKGALLNSSAMMLGGIMGGFMASGITSTNTIYIPLWSSSNLRPRASVINNITSNPLVCGNKLYISDRERLRCIDTDSMTVVWEYEFQAKQASKAQLVRRGDDILMLNLGYGISSLRGIVKCGHPSLGVYDAVAGDEKSLTPLSDKKQVMNDGIITEDGVFLASNDKVAYMSLADHNVSTKTLDVKRDNRLTSIFRTDGAFVESKDGNSLRRIVRSADRCPMLDQSGNIVVFDRNLDTTNSYRKDEIFATTGQCGDVVCVARCYAAGPHDYFLARSNGQFVARLKWQPRKVMLADGYMVTVYKDKLSVASLDSVAGAK